MSFADKVMEGNARIGNFNYRIMGKLFRVLTRRMDNKRLKTQDYDYSDIETKTYSYIEDKNPYHQFDIHQRKDGYHHKGIIISIHGGGLIYGDKNLNRNSIKDLARMGYIVLSPSYSLAPKKSLYEQIHELFTFFQYIIDNRNKLSLFLENVFLIGDSAGGLLSLYCVSISNSPSLQQSFDITQGIMLSFRAITLISTMSKLENTFIKRLALKKADKKRDCYPYLLAATKMIDSHFPPTLMVTSDKDFIRSNSLEVRDRFQEEGVKLSFYDYTSKEKSLEHVFPITYPRYEESLEVYQNVNSFFEKYTFHLSKVLS